MLFVLMPVPVVSYQYLLYEPHHLFWTYFSKIDTIFTSISTRRRRSINTLLIVIICLIDFSFIYRIICCFFFLLFVSSFCCGVLSLLFSLEALPLPSPMIAIACPTSTVSPSLASCSDNTPASSDTTSTLTLSVSNSRIASPFLRYPYVFNHSAMVPSVIDSANSGTLTSGMTYFP